MTDEEQWDSVQLGDKVWVFYDNIQNVEGIVSHVHDRKSGTISVRIARDKLSPKQLSECLVLGSGFVPLVITGGEWELQSKREYEKGSEV